MRLLLKVSYYRFSIAAAAAAAKPISIDKPRPSRFAPARRPRMRSLRSAVQRDRVGENVRELTPFVHVNQSI